MRIGERSMIGAENARIMGAPEVSKNDLYKSKAANHEVGFDRIRGESKTEVSVDKIAEALKSGDDVHALLEDIKDSSTLMNLYREATKKLDPAMSDQDWDAWEKLTQALRDKVHTTSINSETRKVVLGESKAVPSAVEATTSVPAAEVTPDVVSTNQVEVLNDFSPADTIDDEQTLQNEVVEQNEPTLEEKVTQMESILKHKEDVVKSIMKGFTFDQGNGDWIQACSELLSDTQVIDAQLASDMREVADSMRNIKKLYGEQRTDAIERVQRVERAVQQKLANANTQRSGKLNIDVSKQFLTDKDAFGDFKGLVLGGDMGSRNKNTEGYWKSMKKFLASDSGLSAAEKIVDQILQEKIYNNADERGVNKALGAKTLDLLAAVPNKARISAAAA